MSTFKSLVAKEFKIKGLGKPQVFSWNGNSLFEHRNLTLSTKICSRPSERPWNARMHARLNNQTMNHRGLCSSW